MARTGFDPTTISDTTAAYVLGGILVYQGMSYRYVLNSDNATAAGDVLRPTATVSTQNGGTWVTVNNRLVASGGTPAAVSNNSMAGIAVGVIGAAKYGFILVNGYYASVKCEAGVNAGDLIKPSAATDARVNVVSAATMRGGGQATANVAGNLIPALIFCD